MEGLINPSRPKTRSMRAAVTKAVLKDADRISQDLEAIRAVLRAAAWQHARAYQIPLTAPQLLAVQILVDEQRSSGAGLSLSELSRRMRLAHSTVSGIVTRLEHRELLRRATNPADRRFVTVELTGPVKQWLDRDLASSRSAPIARALSQASSQERAAILEGVAALRALVEADIGD